MTPFSYLLVFVLLYFSFHVTALNTCKDASKAGCLVQRDEWKHLVSTEYGRISAVEFREGVRGPYHLQFLTLEPNSLILPVLLHADMVFYVGTGSGTLNWINDKENSNVSLERGDIFRLQAGSVFYIQSHLELTRAKLRIYAIFSNARGENSYDPCIGEYSSVSDLVFGFDMKVLQSAFAVPGEAIRELKTATRPQLIVHTPSKTIKRDHLIWRTGIIESIIGGGASYGLGNKKKPKTFNILKGKPDVQNCNGWSKMVTKEDLHALKGSGIGVFMVNLTKGSMMGPHWNPLATETAIVIQGQGMVHVVCSSSASEMGCKNMRFKVSEGDVFAVPRFHPMAQMSFNNGTLVFVGFNTNARKNHPQFLAGKWSVLNTLNKDILAMSFNITPVTLNRMLGAQNQAVILECTSCAEAEEQAMLEEIEKEKEEAKKKEEEEKKKREKEEEKKKKREKEEEEKKKREQEEEEKKKREKEEEEKKKREQEEEEKKKKQQEEKKRREAAAQREQEDARKQEEKRVEREAEEERRRQQQEEAKRAPEERGRGGDGRRVLTKTSKN